jgi:hypothetical protein
MRPRVPLPALALLCCAALVSSCGDAGQRADPSGAARARVDIRTANCADWVHANARERDVLLAQLLTFFSGPIGDGGRGPEGPGPTLLARQARRVFRSYCAQSFGRALKLYKLFGRAAAFNPAATGG